MARYDFPRTTTMATINGVVIKYDLCNADINAYNSWKDIEYIGYGTIYSIDGVPQNSKEKLHFWSQR